MGSLLVLVFLGLASVGEPGGPSSDRARLEEEAMRRRVAEDRVKSQVLRREEASILKALQSTGDELEQRYLKQTLLFEERSGLERDLEKAEAGLAERQMTLAALRDRVALRAAAMHRTRRTPMRAFLLNATSPLEARRLRERLRLVLQHDGKLVREIKLATQGQAELRGELQKRKDELFQTGERLKEEVDAILSLREERKALLDAVRNERKTIERLAREIAGAADRLAGQSGVVHGLNDAPPPRPGGLAQQKGRLPWPAVGTVEVPFGKRVHLESGLILEQRGIDLRAALGSPVRAIFPGKIAFVGEVDGFGTTVLVDHGGAFSVYAHLDEVMGDVGESLERREMLGTVGDSGSRKGPYLYFELRVARKPVDPLLWLAP